MRALYGIAIRGNGTNEPIEILESLGGVNERQYEDTFNFCSNSCLIIFLFLYLQKVK